MEKNNNPLTPNEISKETKISMKTRVITSLVIALVCIPTFFVGGWFYFALVFVIIAIGTHEILSVERTRRFSLFVFVFSYIIIYALVYWVFVKNQVLLSRELGQSYVFSLERGFDTLSLSTIAIATAAAVLFIVVLANERFSILDATYLFTMIVIMALGSQSFLFMRYYPYSKFAFDSATNPIDVSTSLFKYLHSSFLLIYLVIGVAINDIGAYFIGLFFGRKKVNPRISPKKTWAGLFGGIFVSLVVSTSFALIVDAVGLPILPFLTINEWYWILLLSFAMPLIGNLGDFAFSAIKRQYDIKDFGSLLKGHGGVLDRLDSFIFAAIGLASLITFINNGWDFFL